MGLRIAVSIDRDRIILRKKNRCKHIFSLSCSRVRRGSFRERISSVMGGVSSGGVAAVPRALARHCMR
jgi:hypothetical protein